MTVALVVVAGIVGFICLAGIGANDVANSQGMAVGSGAISLRGAQIIASIFEFLGAALVGQNVSSTVGGKIVDLDAVSAEAYSWGMLAAIMSCAIWMFFATAIKMPVSSTHSIIGALMGFQFVINKGDPAGQHWDVLGQIGLSWIISPATSFLCSILFMYLVDKWWPLLIITDESLNKPLLQIQMVGTPKQTMDNDTTETMGGDNVAQPTLHNKKTFDLSQHFDSPNKPQPLKFSIIFAILWSTLIVFILVAGPKSIKLDIETTPAWIFIVAAIGSFLITMGIGYLLEKTYRKWWINKYYNNKADENNESSVTKGSIDVEYKDYRVFNNLDYFALYLIIASASVSFAHGGNDVANVLGPFGQIFQYEKSGTVDKGARIPIWLAGGGGIAIGVGFILFGKGVLETVGTKIAKVNYQSGFIAQYSAALTVLICDVLGIPVSSSTVIIGAVTGVGFYNTRKETTIRKKMGMERRFTMQDEYDRMNCCGKCLFRVKRMNIKILAKILATWIITIPCNAGICAAVYSIINAIWGPAPGPINMEPTLEPTIEPTMEPIIG